MHFHHLAIILGAVRLAASQDCPATPDVDLPDPVPIVPGNVPTGCSDYEILVARGTGEYDYPDGGKFGLIVGDSLVPNVTAVLPGSRGYPVQYPASSSFISSTLQGSRDVVQRLIGQSARCPDQTFSLVGYSQGAGVMHRAVDSVPRSLYPKIKSLVMFGDPANRLGSEFPSPLDERTLQNCADGDPTCDSDGECVFYHLTYNRTEYIQASTDFIVGAFLA